MSFFGSNGGDGEESTSVPSFSSSPYLSINPNYLDSMDQYILPEDAAPVRSRAQMMFSTIGTATVLGAGVGGAESLRYSGLQWMRVSTPNLAGFCIFAIGPLLICEIATGPTEPCFVNWQHNLHSSATDWPGHSWC